MKPETKKFELQFIRYRNALERKAISLTKKALTEQYNHFLSKVRHTDKSQWMQLADNLPEKPIEDLLTKIYSSCAPLATMTRKQMLKGKADESEQIQNSLFQRKLTNIVQTIAGEKIKTITSTSESAIKKVIRDVLDEADTQGWGIDKITSNLFQEVGANLRGNGYSRARAIAQTEMISASNQASEFAAASTGYEYLKFWSTSGLPNIRESHLEAERFSDDKGGLKPDETFPNGLLYPGDPNGAAEEVINCRCTLMHEII